MLKGLLAFTLYSRRRKAALIDHRLSIVPTLIE